jgi:hypothetical protein
VTTVVGCGAIIISPTHFRVPAARCALKNGAK